MFEMAVGQDQLFKAEGSNMIGVRGRLPAVEFRTELDRDKGLYI